MALAHRGCNVVVHYHRSASEAKRLSSYLCASGILSVAVKGDVSTASACCRLIARAKSLAGNLDILINNASVFHKESLLTATEISFTEELCVNFVAPAVLTREFARRLWNRRVPAAIKGKIINLLDRRISGTEAGCLPYLLSKKMLAEFTRGAALELAPYITVNGVAPGAVLPPAAQRGRHRKAAGTKDLAGKIPMIKKCTPEQVAEAVVFLLESDGITGQVIFVDGGQHLLGGLE